MKTENKRPCQRRGRAVCIAHSAEGAGCAVQLGVGGKCASKQRSGSQGCVCCDNDTDKAKVTCEDASCACVCVIVMSFGVCVRERERECVSSQCVCVCVSVSLPVCACVCLMFCNQPASQPNRPVLGLARFSRQIHKIFSLHFVDLLQLFLALNLQGLQEVVLLREFVL